MSLTDNPKYVEDLAGEDSARVVGARWNIAYSAVVKHRKRLKNGENLNKKPAKKDPVQNQSSGESETHNPDGTASYTRFSEQPWGLDDYREFIKSKGQDPDEVTFTWGWTSNPAGGFWNKLNNVRPKASTVSSVATLEVGKIIKRLKDWEPKPVKRMSGKPEALVVGLADWQLGKSTEYEGTEETVARIKASLSRTVDHVEKLRREGRNLRTLYLVNLGDHIENVSGSYSSQTFEVDLNLRDQIELAVELNILWIKTLAPLFGDVIYTASPCNHAQLTRNGGKSNVTDDADNATGLIAEFVSQICSHIDWLDHVLVQVPRGEMIQTVEIEGVNIATAHGHKITGAEETWLSKQSQRLVHTEKFIPDIWFVAHRHSLSVDDFGPYTRIQATTQDVGSKWFSDQTGKYSRPGTTTFVVGEHLPGKWDDLKVL